MNGRRISAAFALVTVGVTPLALTVACSDPMTPRIASKLAFTTQPSTAAAGMPITPALVVAVLDKDGQPVTSANKTITLEMVTNSAGARLSGATSVVAVDGVATFSDVSATRLGAYRLIATSEGLISTVSEAFNVTFGPAANLVFIAQPAMTSPGSIISPSVVVEVRDSFGNRVTNAATMVTIAISANGGGGTLSGTTSVAPVNGLATFSNLSINNAGEGYTLVATAANLTSSPSGSFDVRAPINFATITAGYFHTCGLSVGGRAYCWGQDADGQLGGAHGMLPGPVSGGYSFATISAGRTYTCGITTSGATYCWGGNYSGELGTGGSKTAVPTLVAGAFTALSAGYSHTCAVTGSGAGYCWGDNSAGQIGNSTTGQSSVPAAVSGGLAFSSISPGRFFTCGLTTDGTAYCWGDNSLGELGDGTTAQRTSPVPVSTPIKFIAVSAGGFHACGLATNSAVYCWGENGSGQLGNGTQTSSSIPVQVSGGRPYATLSAGNRHTCAVTTGGAAYCWGDNGPQHLGTGGSASSSTPVAVVGNLTFGNVSAGRFHTCGATTAGAGYCWGDNAFGRLGNGSTASSPSPVAVR